MKEIFVFLKENVPGENFIVLICDFPTWTVMICIPFFAFKTKNLPATEPTATYIPRLSTARAEDGFCEKSLETYFKHN